MLRLIKCNKTPMPPIHQHLDTIHFDWRLFEHFLVLPRRPDRCFCAASYYQMLAATHVNRMRSLSNALIFNNNRTNANNNKQAHPFSLFSLPSTNNEKKKKIYYRHYGPSAVISIYWTHRQNKTGGLPPPSIDDAFLLIAHVNAIKQWYDMTLRLANICSRAINF